MLEEIKQKADIFRKKLAQLRTFLKITAKIAEIEYLQEKMNLPDFWNAQESANKVVSTLKHLRSIVDPFERLSQKVEDLDELADICSEDAESVKEVYEELTGLEPDMLALETKSLLSGPFDKNNAPVAPGKPFA